MTDTFDTAALPELEYDRQRSVYRVPYDDEPVMTALLATARVLETDPLELPVLGERIDPEDIERFVRYRDAGHIAESTLTFYVDDVEVTVEEGSLLLREPGTST